MTDAELAELLRTVIARPDDLDVMSVYADALTMRGDPRGELILVQLQRRTADSPALVARERELTAQLDAALVDEIGQPNTAFAWHRGFLDAVDFKPDRQRRALGDAIRKIGVLPAARQLRRIVIRFLQPGWGAMGQVISTLTRVAPQLRSLRELVFTGADREDGNAQTHILSVGDLSLLCRALPKLEVLEVPLWDRTTVGDVGLPSLRRLVLESPRTLDRAFTMAPRLEEVEIWDGRWEMWQLAPLLDQTTVRHLLISTSDADHLMEVADALPSAPMRAGLETLHLLGAALTREGAEALCGSAPALRHLDKIVIERTAHAGPVVEALGDIVHFA